MFLGRNIREYRSSLAWSLVALALLLAPALAAQQEIQPPKITSISTDRGLAAPQQELTLNVHLTPHNEAAYKQAVEDLYTTGSRTLILQSMRRAPVK